jgi:hypothetical protein
MSNIDWLETNIKSKNIKSFDCEEFNNYEVIGRGRYGLIKSAEWNNRGIKVALKILNTLDEIVKEVS